MGKILAAYLLPHPPIILKEIGKGREEEAQMTIDGMKKASMDIKEKAPATIVIVTPHGPLFRDAIAISKEEDLRGDFSRFGHGELQFRYKNNTRLAREIIENSLRADIPIIGVDSETSRDYRIEKDLDHGALVPLYFIDKEYRDYKLVHITYGLLSPEKLFKFGKVLANSAEVLDEDVIIIASGDLSHRLSSEGPYDYSPEGEKFDKEIVDIIKDGRMEDIVSFDLDLAESAGECGLRSLMVMAGAIDSYKLDAEVFSYEGPFGVGYSTARIDLSMKEESTYVRLARKSLEHYVKNGEEMSSPDKITGIKKGVFVTLKKNGKLRGCIGTISPTRESVEIEIIQNAISAGTEDPRFAKVREDELDEIVYSVDVLEEAEEISSIEDLDIDKYGVIVSSGYRRGLLLPNLDGIDSVQEQVEIALNKAGISPNEKYKMERFEVKRYH